MGTFGTTTIGGLSGSLASNAPIYGGLYTVPSTIDNYYATRISIALALDAGTASLPAKAGIYKDADNSFKAATGESTIDLTATPTWFHFDFATPYLLTSGEDVALVVWVNNSGGLTIKPWMAAGTKNFYGEDAAPYGANFPDPIAADWDLEQANRDVSVYCTYQEGYILTDALTVTDALSNVFYNQRHNAEFWREVVNGFENTHGDPSPMVTWYDLSLGSPNATTGWFDALYRTDTVEMLIIPRGHSLAHLGLGFHSVSDATGYTLDPRVKKGDKVATDIQTFRILHVEPWAIGDLVHYYTCDLKEVESFE